MPIIAYLSGLSLGKFSAASASPNYQQLDTLYSDHQTWLPETKWTEIRNNFLQKLEDRDHSDPLTIFFLTNPSHFPMVGNFSNHLSKMFAQHSNGEFHSYKRDRSEITATTRSVLVDEFTSLPWKEAKVFMELCDNDNSPNPFTLFVFIAEQGPGQCDLGNPDRSVEEVLVGRWRDEFEVESIEALAARISSISVCVT